MRQMKKRIAIAACVSALSGFVPSALAGDVKVNCDSPGANGKIGKALSRLDPAATNVVHVRGHCKENVVIRGFGRLSLIADPGAIIEALDDSLAVVEIVDSNGVVVQGFTIRGGSTGLFCRDFSYCRFVGDTVEDSKVSGGIVVGVAQARLTDIVVRNTASNGIIAVHAKIAGENISVDGVSAGPQAAGVGVHLVHADWLAGTVTIQGAADSGFLAEELSGVNGGPITVTGSGLDGITMTGGSSLLTWGLTATGNGRAGVFLWNGASASLGGATLSNNATSGLMIVEGASAELYDATISENKDTGITVGVGSSAFLQGGSVSYNQWVGINLNGGANVAFGGGVSVSSNGFSGLYVTDVSTATVWAPTNFTPNGGYFDISCGPPGPGGYVMGLENATYASTNCQTSPTPLARAPSAAPRAGLGRRPLPSGGDW